jgi:hypothetical protein
LTSFYKPIFEFMISFCADNSDHKFAIQVYHMVWNAFPINSVPALCVVSLLSVYVEAHRAEHGYFLGVKKTTSSSSPPSSATAIGTGLNDLSAVEKKKCEIADRSYEKVVNALITTSSDSDPDIANKILLFYIARFDLPSAETFLLQSNRVHGHRFNVLSITAYGELVFSLRDAQRARNFYNFLIENKWYPFKKIVRIMQRSERQVFRPLFRPNLFENSLALEAVAIDSRNEMKYTCKFTEPSLGSSFTRYIEAFNGNIIEKQEKEQPILPHKSEQQPSQHASDQEEAAAIGNNSPLYRKMKPTSASYSKAQKLWRSL